MSISTYEHGCKENAKKKLGEVKNADLLQWVTTCALVSLACEVCKMILHLNRDLMAEYETFRAVCIMVTAVILPSTDNVCTTKKLFKDCIFP